MIHYKQGDIVMFPFRYQEDPEQFKVRPIVLLTKEDKHGNFLSAKVTSVPRLDSHSFVLDNTDLDKSIKVDSQVRVNDLIMANKKYFTKRISHLNPSGFNLLIEKICNTIKL